MEFTTLVHEYAHELLHRADDRPASRNTRELEAEGVAVVHGAEVPYPYGGKPRVIMADIDQQALHGALARALAEPAAAHEAFGGDVDIEGVARTRIAKALTD